MKQIFIDFEFTDSQEKFLNLICCTVEIRNHGALSVQEFWLQGDEVAKSQLKDLIITARKEGYAFYAYNVVSEARCFITLGLDPVLYPWVDLHLEDKMCCNSNDHWGYGKQLSKGKIIDTVNVTRWGKTEEQLQSINMSKPDKNLASACYRYLKIEIDSKEKDACRDLILTKKRGFTKQEAERIQKYCTSDVELLCDLWEVIRVYYDEFFTMDYLPEHKKMKKELNSHIFSRGRYAALTALMEYQGYPVDRDMFTSFIENSAEIIIGCQNDVASQFEDYKPFVRKYKTKEPRTLRMDTKAIRSWIEKESGHKDKWMKTDSGLLSLSKDAWLKFYNYRHDYPRNNYAAQIIRFLKLKESMNGFLSSGKRGSILDSYSHNDSRIRTYFNIFGAQSGRTQPRATSFIPLKAAWSRSLINTNEPHDHFICGIDYSSQEVLIQAILSGDDALFDSYNSGDVYLDFAKKAGAVPKDGKREDYKDIRNLFKATFLGISYGMQSNSLSVKLSSDTGKQISKDEAQDLINKYYTVYNKYKDYLESIDTVYYTSKFLSTPDGWVLFGNNLNQKSWRNFMVQGAGSSVMRKAVEHCYSNVLKVTYTLHDAVYCELEKESQIQTMDQCLKQGFIDCFPENPEWASCIRTDISCFGRYFESNQLKDKSIETSVIYVDERSKKDFDFFSPYFNKANKPK